MELDEQLGGNERHNIGSDSSHGFAGHRPTKPRAEERASKGSGAELAGEHLGRKCDEYFSKLSLFSQLHALPLS